MILENVRPRNSRFWLRSCIEFLESFRQFVSSFFFPSSTFFLLLSHFSPLFFFPVSILGIEFPFGGGPERQTGSCFESCCAFGQTGQGLFFPLGEKVYRGVFLFAFGGRMESLIGLERIKEIFVNKNDPSDKYLWNICGEIFASIFEISRENFFFFFIENFCGRIYVVFVREEGILVHVGNWISVQLC